MVAIKTQIPAWALAGALVACEGMYGESVSPPEATEELEVEAVLLPAASVSSPQDITPASIEDTDPALAAWLRDGEVSKTKYARRVLYSWASEKAVARMRADRELFDDDQLPEGPTPYVQRLEHTAARDNPGGQLARLLLGHPDLRRRRYAWSRPWATRLGIVRPYGDQLIAVLLRPDAIMARYDPSDMHPWHFADLDGRAVPLARVLADPSRLGGVLHVRRDGDPGFREFVLCNESAIESWSLATPVIDEVLREDAQSLRRLAAYPVGSASVEFDHARAFAVPHYDPEPGNLVTIAEALEDSTQTGAAFIVMPRKRFDHDADPATVSVRKLPPRFVATV